jgi:hypothetical protein
LNHIAFSNVFHLPRNVVKGKEWLIIGS